MIRGWKDNKVTLFGRPDAASLFVSPIMVSILLSIDSSGSMEYNSTVKRTKKRTKKHTNERAYERTNECVDKHIMYLLRQMYGMM